MKLLFFDRVSIKGVILDGIYDFFVGVLNFLKFFLDSKLDEMSHCNISSR